MQVNERENIHLDVSEKKCVKAVFKQTIALNMTLIDFPEDIWKDTEEILTRLEKSRKLFSHCSSRFFVILHEIFFQPSNKMKLRIKIMKSL